MEGPAIDNSASRKGENVWVTEGKTWRLLAGSPPILYTKPETRIFITCIDSDVTQRMLISKLRKYGDVQVIVFCPMANNLSWAWVGFKKGEAVLKLLEGKAEFEVDQASKTEEVLQEACSEIETGRDLVFSEEVEESVTSLLESQVRPKQNLQLKAKSVALAPLRVDALETEAEKDPLTFETRASARDLLK